MAAPIFKFKNVRVPITSTADTLVYAVDIGLGNKGLDLGVLPEEVSSVVLTVQCSNNWSYLPDKELSAVTASDNTVTYVGANALDDNLQVGMGVTFRGIAYGNITLGKKYYIKSITAGSNKFTISEFFANGVVGTEFDISADGSEIIAGGKMYMDIDSSVSVTAKIKDLVTNTSVNLVTDYNVLPNNAFDPLNGNLVLTSKLGLFIQADVAGVIDVTVSLLEIANATAT